MMLHKHLFSKYYTLTSKCKLRLRCDIADGIADLVNTLFNSQYLIRLAILVSHIYLIYKYTVCSC